MPNYDLHSHSTASDGTLSPTELVYRAGRQGVDVLALTDHDTLAGLKEAREAANTIGLTLINGVEISVTWAGGTVHLVGLQVAAEDVVLQQGLAGLREFRCWRAEEIGRRLFKQAKIENAFEGARKYALGDLVSRTHFARFLVDNGHAKSVQEVFKRFLVNNKPGHVPGQWASLEQAVAWIGGAGGIAVLAHPARYKMTATKLRALVGEFKECGGRAIEVVSGSHTPDEAKTMARNANNAGLLASSGSDYHGPENPWIELGRLPALPAGCVPVWHDWQPSVMMHKAI